MVRRYIVYHWRYPPLQQGRRGDQQPANRHSTESLSIDTVLIEANVLPVRTFQLNEQFDLQDSRITSVRFSPETVRVAARSEVLEQMDSLPIDLSGIDADNLENGTNVITVRVQKPSEDAVLSNDTVILTIEVDQGK